MHNKQHVGVLCCKFLSQLRNYVAVECKYEHLNRKKETEVEYSTEGGNVNESEIQSTHVFKQWIRESSPQNIKCTKVTFIEGV